MSCWNMASKTGLLAARMALWAAIFSFSTLNTKSANFLFSRVACNTHQTGNSPSEVSVLKWLTGSINAHHVYQRAVTHGLKDL